MEAIPSFLSAQLFVSEAAEFLKRVETAFWLYLYHHTALILRGDNVLPELALTSRLSDRRRFLRLYSSQIKLSVLSPFIISVFKYQSVIEVRTSASNFISKSKIPHKTIFFLSRDVVGTPLQITPLLTSLIAPYYYVSTLKVQFELNLMSFL